MIEGNDALAELAALRKVTKEEALDHAIRLAIAAEKGKARNEEPVMLCPGGGIRPLPGWCQPNLKRRRFDG